MKRGNYILLAASSAACVGLLSFACKLISPRLATIRLTKYEDKHLLLAHQNKYTPNEIKSLRESFSRPMIYSEVLFEEATTKGRYVNKLANGSRLSWGTGFCKSATSDRIIWLFGGSTTYGYGVEDDQTIASQLSKELLEKHKEYCIINFGRGGFNSTQELLLYTRLLAQSDKKPKYTFFIDGLNDHQQLLGSILVPKNNQSTFFIAYNQILHNRLTSKIFGEPVIPVTMRPTVPDYCNLKTSSISDSCNSLIKHATDRMINNWETASRLSTAYDIEFIPLLQPIPPYKHHFINPFSSGKYIYSSLAGIGYSLMDKDSSGGRGRMKDLGYIDASTAFQLPLDSCRLPYVDHVHYSGCGNRLVAKMMARRVK